MVIDAGPSLNFMSIHKQRILIDCLGPISMPETVYSEIERRSQQDRRFSAAQRVLLNLKGSAHLNLLRDDPTNRGLAEAVERVAASPMAQRLQRSQDLGEVMVMAHCAVIVESGLDVVMLIDDGPAKQAAAREIRHLRAMKTSHPSMGEAYLLGTVDVLARAIKTSHLPDRRAMRDLCARMWGLDDGLTAADEARLLNHPRWDSPLTHLSALRTIALVAGIASMLRVLNRLGCRARPIAFIQPRFRWNGDVR